MTSAADRQAQSDAYVNRHLQTWFGQKDWASAEAVELMKALMANDADAVAQHLPKVDLTVPPPVYPEEVFAGFNHPLSQAENTPWLTYAVYAKADEVVRLLLKAGVDPVVPDPNEEGTSPLFIAFNQAHVPTCQAFMDLVPGLDAAGPVTPSDGQLDSYGPLAATLCHTSPKAIVQADGSDAPEFAGSILPVMRALIQRGGQWNDATREAVLHGAVMCGRPALLAELEQAGCRLADASVATQQALLVDAINLRRIYEGDMHRSQPTEGGDREWLAFFAARQIELPAQALDLMGRPEFESGLAAYAQLRAQASAVTPPAPAVGSSRRRGPGH